MKEDKRQSTDLEDLKPYLIEDLIADFEKRREWVKTGFPGLDKQVRIPPGAITVVAASTSQGKTSFLLNLLVNMLRNGNKKLYFFCYEDANRSIATKIIMIMAGEIIQESNDNFENYERYLEQYKKRKRAGKNNKVEQAISEFVQYTSTERLFIYDHTFEANKLAKRVRELASKEMTGAIFIDYIQKIPIRSSQNRQRYLDLQKVSECLLEAIKDRKVPLIVAAQARNDNIQLQPGGTKKSTTEKKHPIRLDSIREAADIGQDASLVLGLSLNRSNNSDTNKKGRSKSSTAIVTMEVSILKNRNGRAGDIVSLLFNGPVFTISEPYY